jgi:hypothetical protein
VLGNWLVSSLEIKKKEKKGKNLSNARVVDPLHFFYFFFNFSLFFPFFLSPNWRQANYQAQKKGKKREKLKKK